MGDAAGMDFGETGPGDATTTAVGGRVVAGESTPQFIESVRLTATGFTGVTSVGEGGVACFGDAFSRPLFFLGDTFSTLAGDGAMTMGSGSGSATTAMGSGTGAGTDLGTGLLGDFFLREG